MTAVVVRAAGQPGIRAVERDPESQAIIAVAGVNGRTGQVVVIAKIDRVRILSFVSSSSQVA